MKTKTYMVARIESRSNTILKSKKIYPKSELNRNTKLLNLTRIKINKIILLKSDEDQVDHAGIN